ANDFDGFHDALLPQTDLDGETFVEYIKDRGEAYDIPYEKIVSAFNHAYGKDEVEKWSQHSSTGCRPTA
ncbi:MAG: hypothetical protein KAI69_02220, partial [Deltaproteobacteria bacterium]|nr:hypothetical protein [Deltaproteobacteria bacterium]